MRKLKTMGESIVTASPTSGEFYHYEPGNGTRYEVFITERYGNDIGAHYPYLVIQVANFGRPCSMVIPVFDGKHSINPDYMCEKMDVSLADAEALIRLIDLYMED